MPLATGGTWQVSAIHTVLTAAVGGKDLYLKVNKDHDAKAARGPEMRKIWEAFAALRADADPRYVGLSWNESTAMVMTGKAGGQIMGDWAQGKFSLAGKVAGQDYDCLPGLAGFGFESFSLQLLSNRGFRHLSDGDCRLVAGHGSRHGGNAGRPPWHL